MMMNDRLGLAFFTFAATVSAMAAWENPTLLAWLAAFHNAILAALYSRRNPAQQSDCLGLWLGLLAAVLPLLTTHPTSMPIACIILGSLGYALIFWSLFSLGARFGIAPADRGLVTTGPYRLVRHPMYLGELILRATLVAALPQRLVAVGCLLALAAIQILRALREEHILEGYPEYAHRVGYRLIPGVW